MSDTYERGGPEWAAEVMKMRKSDIVEMLRDECLEHQSVARRLRKVEERWLVLTAKIACMNTMFRELVRKWNAEGEHCGAMGREADEEWEDGELWRERRAVFFDCATELEAAIRKVPRRQRLSENAPGMARRPNHDGQPESQHDPKS